MTLTVTDLFCGAGGSSLGASAAGLELVMAANHWQTAIDVHQVAFPDAAHDVADISQVDPRRYPTTDILLASPECTNQSGAKGVSRKKQSASLFDSPEPAAERSRATMWDVVRFAEHHRYTAIVVENVVEATAWILWPAWVQALTDLGYRLTLLSHNSMDHGVPQSRDRIYGVWLRDGLTANLEMERDAHCLRCDATRPVRQAWKNGRTVGKYGPQWFWACTTCGAKCDTVNTPAASIIDWDRDCPRIGDRARPLAANTRARILAGLRRHGWAPIVTNGAGNTFETTPGNRARPVTDPLPTQQTTAQHALAFLYQTAHGGRVSDIGAPLATVCASDDRQSLIVANTTNNIPRSIDEPLTTVVAGTQRHGLLMRNNGTTSGESWAVTPTSEPAKTMTTKGHQSLLMPYYGNATVRSSDDPLGTVTVKDRWAHIDPDQLVDDCGFRMLEPYEIAAAMAFPDGYIPRDLTKRDQVKLAGNAVTPPVMTWITGRIAQAIEAAA